MGTVSSDGTISFEQAKSTEGGVKGVAGADAEVAVAAAGGRLLGGEQAEAAVAEPEVKRRSSDDQQVVLSLSLAPSLAHEPSPAAPQAPRDMIAEAVGHPMRASYDDAILARAPSLEFQADRIGSTASCATAAGDLITPDLEGLGYGCRSLQAPDEAAGETASDTIHALRMQVSFLGSCVSA
jgi:hypothetical protein